MKVRLAILATIGLLFGAAGCSVDTELGGVHIPNSSPETRITGSPPTLLEASYAVQFNWTGSDSDGKVVGYQWKISDNGTDGISPIDTVTVDPLTGAEINPWHFTTANDSLFLVLADQSDFPGDEHGDPRSFRSHTLFVRAVDDEGQVDPSPAHISFTATTLVPTCRAVYPNLASQDVQTVPPTVNMSWRGEDPDFNQLFPTKVRFLWKRAVDANGNFIRSRDNFNQHWHEVLSFEDPDWSPWLRYSPLEEERLASFGNQTPNEYFFFAVQVEDTAGAQSVDFGYQQQVAHVWVREGFYRPNITLTEPFLGFKAASEASYEIAGGQPVNFVWTANADSYNGQIVSFRHGWDLVDPSDPNDPGWAVPPGLSEQNLFDAERTFQEGIHTFYLRVEDDSGQVSIVTRILSVIPFVERDRQLELLVLDQVKDDGVQNWPDQAGRPRNEQEYRNAFWRFLGDGSGGVSGIIWERDWFDHTVRPTFSDLVKYKAVLCYARANDEQRMFSQFRPRRGIDQFVWMTPYQERGGNLFLVGGSSMESFLDISVANYMVPMIFDTRETTYLLGGNSYVVGFGTKELPDGTEVQRGPLMYPYATAGIAALDWSSPYGKNIYARQFSARFDRHVDCVGIKGIYMDDDFKANHLIGPGVIPDTLWTDPEIDWHDVVDARADTLALFHMTFPFREDEFIDANISGTRPTPITPQECNDERYPAIVPNGMCVEPMMRGIARFDWLREYRWRQGETDWPASRYSQQDLDDGCGSYALTNYNGIPRAGARTTDKVFGYFSYKMVPDKPVKKADVFWGFDPYRFDQEGSKDAIRWVLEYFGLVINP